MFEVEDLLVSLRFGRRVQAPLSRARSTLEVEGGLGFGVFMATLVVLGLLKSFWVNPQLFKLALEP